MGYLTSPNRRSSSNTDSGRNAAGLQGRMLTDEMKSVTDSAWRVELGQYPQIHPSPCPWDHGPALYAFLRPDSWAGPFPSTPCTNPSIHHAGSLYWVLPLSDQCTQ